MATNQRYVRKQGQKASRIRSTVRFPYTNNYHKLFTELQSFETGDEYGGKNKMCLFTINYLLHMFYNIR